MRLRLPVVLTVAVVSAAAVVACQNEAEHYFCFEADGRPDAGSADATSCNVTVTDPADCPEGCTAEPLG